MAALAGALPTCPESVKSTAVCGAGATIEMKVQYFAAARGGTVTCQSSFLKKGRRTFFLQSTARDDAGESIAHATSTWKLL